MTAGVHAHATADRSRDADRPLEPGQAGGRRAPGEHRQEHAGAGTGDGVVGELDLLGDLAERDRDTVEAAVGDEEVRAAADDQGGNSGASHDVGHAPQVGEGLGTDEQRRRAADPVGRERPERDVAPRQRAEVGGDGVERGGGAHRFPLSAARAIRSLRSLIARHRAGDRRDHLIGQGRHVATAHRDADVAWPELAGEEGDEIVDGAAARPRVGRGGRRGWRRRRACR